MSNGNVHADMMMEYAMDSKNDPKAYKNWQFRIPGANKKWSNLSLHPQWTDGHEYRRRPLIVDLPPYSISLPVMHENELEIGQSYYVPALHDPDGYEHYHWLGDGQANLLLERRLIYKSPKDAVDRLYKMVMQPAIEINHSVK